MFSRNKDAAAVVPDSATSDEAPDSAISTGKGRPTPKRKAAEAANRRPLVPTDRRAAAKEARAKERVARQRQYEALQTGDERHLPPRDKGPEKRYVREYVDARWNLGELFLPVAILFIVATLLANAFPSVAIILLIVLYGFVLLVVIDSFILWWGLRKRLRTKFGDIPRGTAMYAVMRAFQIRRARLPKPLHKKHGNYPA